MYKTWQPVKIIVQSTGNNFLYGKKVNTKIAFIDAKINFWNVQPKRFTNWSVLSDNISVVRHAL